MERKILKNLIVHIINLCLDLICAGKICKFNFISMSIYEIKSIQKKTPYGNTYCLCNCLTIAGSHMTSVGHQQDHRGGSHHQQKSQRGGEQRGGEQGGGGGKRVGGMFDDDDEESQESESEDGEEEDGPGEGQRNLIK